MKKKDFIKLAVMGLSSGLLITNQLDASLLAAEEAAASNPSSGENSESGDNDDSYENDRGNLGYHLLSEDELLDELNEKGEKLYMKLSSEGKDLARKVASQRCNGTNECKGLNACRAEGHDCAGQGSCKGQGKCGFSDKNLAVKIASLKMAEKK